MDLFVRLFEVGMRPKLFLLQILSEGAHFFGSLLVMRQLVSEFDPVVGWSNVTQVIEVLDTRACGHARGLQEVVFVVAVHLHQRHQLGFDFVEVGVNRLNKVVPQTYLFLDAWIDPVLQNGAV